MIDSSAQSMRKQYRPTEPAVHVASSPVWTSTPSSHMLIVVPTSSATIVYHTPTESEAALAHNRRFDATQQP